jgi:very-short-patch-repair endonuclease
MKQESESINITAEDVKRRGLIWVDNHLPYNPDNVEKARLLRKNMTQAEKKLWFQFLSRHKVRFLKQRPIDQYIVDFYCASHKLAIEIDGGAHYTDSGIDYDKQRTELLNLYGVKVIRFRNDEVINNFESVCKRINKIIS